VIKIKKLIQCTTGPLQYLIDNGETIDFRLDEATWTDLAIGDHIRYFEDFTGWQTEPAPNSRLVTAQITDIFRVSSFQELIIISKSHGVFQDENPDEIIVNLRKWWTPEKEKTIGVLGWKVRAVA
jgi:ASC-1-like (ASCH) protein